VDPRALSSKQVAVATEVDVNASLGLSQLPREMSKDEQIEHLTEEHRRMDERLKQLERQISMTSTEQVEYQRLKKQKLQTKDRLLRLRS
jgi:uncharacterized protein YdcH (DUF465 family)